MVIWDQMELAGMSRGGCFYADVLWPEILFQSLHHGNHQWEEGPGEASCRLHRSVGHRSRRDDT